MKHISLHLDCFVWKNAITLTFWEFYGEFGPCTVKVPYAILKLCLVSEYIEILIYASEFVIQLEKQHLSYNLEAPHELKIL